ncbi:hypothetical protein CERSUDRAFT_74345 [Gelatoporia subvermispora B]|uniref:Uncharacterized protein n=1 Tax=Ceriporiopsis subvermispora (strain B) TaxID=914234 RepID=M2QW63_CERS8|nr:hypothetical protein CERSUDRAFT_74345 [Gelatoporia subvermispora B]
MQGGPSQAQHPGRTRPLPLPKYWHHPAAQRAGRRGHPQPPARMYRIAEHLHLQPAYPRALQGRDTQVTTGKSTSMTRFPPRTTPPLRQLHSTDNEKKHVTQMRGLLQGLLPPSLLGKQRCEYSLTDAKHPSPRSACINRNNHSRVLITFLQAVAILAPLTPSAIGRTSFLRHSSKYSSSMYKTLPPSGTTKGIDCNTIATTSRSSTRSPSAKDYAVPETGSIIQFRLDSRACPSSLEQHHLVEDGPGPVSTMVEASPRDTHVHEPSGMGTLCGGRTLPIFTLLCCYDVMALYLEADSMFDNDLLSCTSPVSVRPVDGSSLEGIIQAVDALVKHMRLLRSQTYARHALHAYNRPFTPNYAHVLRPPGRARMKKPVAEASSELFFVMLCQTPPLHGQLLDLSRRYTQNASTPTPWDTRRRDHPHCRASWTNHDNPNIIGGCPYAEGGLTLGRYLGGAGEFAKV